MPVASTVAYVRDLLNGQSLPGGGGRLDAFVAPPDPKTDSTNPAAYVWMSRGATRRVSGPRSVPPPNLWQATANGPRGWKKMTHNISIWITWFDDNSDAQADSTFPTVLDWVMMMLETCHMPQDILDPSTGSVSAQIINLGQNLEYEWGPVRSTASQREQRQDALITAPTEEWVQR